MGIGRKCTGQSRKIHSLVAAEKAKGITEEAKIKVAIVDTVNLFDIIFWI